MHITSTTSILNVIMRMVFYLWIGGLGHFMTVAKSHLIKCGLHLLKKIMKNFWTKPDLKFYTFTKNGFGPLKAQPEYSTSESNLMFGNFSKSIGIATSAMSVFEIHAPAQK